MIWDYIRNFLVEYIFGGYTSGGDQYQGLIGYNDTIGDVTTANTFYPIGAVNINGSNTADYFISLGDWLSTTTTIIIMCVIVFLFALLVRWIFKAVTSAFLLK